MIKWINKYKNRITALSGFLIVIGFALKTLGYTTAADFALILATLIAVVPIMYKAYLALRMKAFSIELLVTIAVIGALFIREYTESSVVTFLFLFGDFLEARTLEKTRSSLRSLIDMAPQEAIVLHGTDQVVVPVEEVAVGDRLFIKPGGKIPVDGIIVKGQAAINEAAVTGEAIPANKS
ncbi:MAG: cation-transporting P-type ATPase, partial [Trichococcus flocculiformis]